jgi:four helix bundle protein
MQHKLDDLEVYTMAMDIGRQCYELAAHFSEFDRRTIGSQLVRAADSIAANIAEGYGRFSRKEQKQFCYYARGSLYETRTWLAKAQERHCITDEHAETLQALVQQCGKMLNAYIRFLNNEQVK